MKKPRLLIALLVMLVAASGYAQDSYRETVSRYLSLSGMDKQVKTAISSMSKLYKQDGPVDVGQLTQRYLDERCEEDMIDFMTAKLASLNLTEPDLKAVDLLLSDPRNKVYDAHQQAWIEQFLADFFMHLSERYKMDSDSEPVDSTMKIEDTVPGLKWLLGPPLQPREDIDAAYAAKFKEVMVGSAFWNTLLAGMVGKLDEKAAGDSRKQEDQKVFVEWMGSNLSALLLNSAYGIMTLEDLDFAFELYTNEAYSKLLGFAGYGDDGVSPKDVMSKYRDWMEEHGAVENEDPEAAIDVLKSVFKLDGLNLDLLKIDD